MYEIKSNLPQVSILLTELAQRVENASPLMGTISGIMHDEVEENFAQQGRPKWLGLAPSTIKVRTKRGTWPGMMLQVSGQLAASITPSSDARSAKVSTNKKYAAIQHSGGQAGRGKKVNLPARPYMLITGTGEQRIIGAAQSYLIGLVK
ncbi:MAG: phage virion morphogenesis protein [Gallionellaceae bacterium]|nr:phage virion morphogenesis protein [Gallionellaceae bacterium]